MAMKATGRRKNIFRIFGLAGLTAALIATTVFSGLLGVDWLESHRGFCNACHLTENRPLHEEKMRIALRSPPLDEAGVHFQGAGGDRFSCATCHRGEGIMGRSEVLWDSFRNSVIYFLGDFEEPKEIGRPVGNSTCTQCHTVNETPRNLTLFHGIRAHRYPLPVGCTECHVAHFQHPEQERHIRAVMARIQTQCGQCHDVHPPTPDMVRVLNNYRRGQQN